MTTNNETIDLLNNLIETAKDGEKGFREAAKHAHAVDLRTVFADYSSSCGRSASELQQCVQMLGGKPETSGTVAGALHRGWMNLKTSVTSADDLALLEECERGEDHAKAQYSKAIKRDVPAEVRAVIEKQYQGALRNHDRIRDLRNRERQAA